MSMSQLSAPEADEATQGEPVTIGGMRYLRAPVRVFFPDAEDVSESKGHMEQCSLLYQILKLAFAERAAIGSDQFVYWDPTDPSECLAPDAFVRLGVPDDRFRSWKVWERGAPEVAVEIISSIDERDRNWPAKLAKYRRLGVRELVRFDPESQPPSLRIWDAIDADLVERDGVERCSPSLCLPGAWVVVDDPEAGPLLRLSMDREGQHLYPTPVDVSEARRLAAEQRVRELEEELRRRG